MKSVPILFLMMFLMIGCNAEESSLDVTSSDVQSGVTFVIESAEGRSISISQWTVTSMDIIITGTINKTVTWKAGSSDNIVIPLPEGEYNLKLVHHGEYQGVSVSAEERASFSIEPFKITIIQITPGATGTIQIKPTASPTPSSTPQPTSTTGSIMVNIPIPPQSQGQVESIRSSMVGTWVGTMQCSWIAGTTPVKFVFRNDNSYSSMALEGTAPALYYGTDSDSSLKLFQVYGLTGTGAGIAQLVIYFKESDTQVVETINDIVVTNTTLDFNFRHLGSYGPLYYHLTKQ